MPMSDPISSVLNFGFGLLGNQIARSDSENFTREMWNRQNEYNRPINQVARAREAGINPFAMLQQGGFNSGSADQPNPVSPAYGDYSPGFDMFGSMQQSSLISLQDANNRKVSAEADRQLIANRYAVTKEIRELDNMLADKNLKDEERANLEKRKDLLQKDLDSYDQRLQASLGSQREQANLAKQQSFTEEMKRRFIAANVRLSNQQVALLAEEAKKVREEVEQMKLNGISQREINRFIASKEQETARKLHIENEKLSRLIGAQIENLESGTDKNRRQQVKRGVTFFGVPLVSQDDVYIYDRGNSLNDNVWTPHWSD